MDIPTYTEIGRPGRVIIARLGEGQDVIDGALALIGAHQFGCGTITAMGALKRGAVNSPRSFEFADPCEVMVCHRMEGPVELALARGVFGRDEEGELDFHLHGVLMDKDGHMCCGDLVQGQNPVWCMVELTITEIEGVMINPIHNKLQG